ncbi:predicted protein [Naegleria gruberi]|uniref:Predicted protein n=1 Tax=Naegleria gruberi TaxID=5762 RepID=D2V1N9_NAEGR|nr:uncharacterized protein NAEGRDRAFT_30199 [Naegleria gruberi]EFC49343.1 predicted protein [Naegleria gruberi]|eukprot:XP_002682087.1 predicted protein [Naegleria gruberi strain NEG-M]
MYGGAYDEKEALNYFQHFKKLYLKRYATEEEHHRRWKIFYDNINLVNQLNIMHKPNEIAGKPVAQYGITQFMDMSPNEFARVKLLPPTKQKDINHTPTAPKEKYQIDALPESFDWREHGAVTAVKDQASCGSCWAFSTVENIEGAYFLAGHNLTKFSPQQLVDCDNLNCGCFGGFPFIAMQYIQKRGGLATESSYPYCIPPLGNCFPCNTNKTYCPSGEYCNRTCSVQNYQLVAKVAGYENVSQNEDDIAAYLVKNGPLSICLNAMWLQFYHSGISDPMYCPPDIDHAVLLVGFGTHTNWLGEKTNYWIVKNSWGESWGEKGYFRLIRGKDKCGINTMVANAIVGKTKF